MHVGSVGYIPPKGRFNSDAFIANLSAWKASYPIYLFSDDPLWQVEMVANPEAVKNPRKPFGVQNCLFLFGLKIAKDAGLDYFLHLEADCRVRGDGWDEIIFQDFFRESRTPLFGGTPVLFNISQSGPNCLRKSIELAYNYQRTTGCLSPVHGAWPGAPVHCSLFPNGALGVYHTKTMLEIFDGFEQDIGRYSMGLSAWDFDISDGMWKKFGEGVFDQFQFATQCYSGYQDSLMTYDQRRHLLVSGKMVGIHQVGTNEAFTE